MGIRSVVTIAIRKDGKLLLVPKRKGGETIWCFPSGEFNDRLNGDLSDAVKRVLHEFLAEGKRKGFEAIYLGSYLHKIGKNVRVCYNFILEGFDGHVKAKTIRWLAKDEIKKVRTDLETSLFVDSSKV